MTERLDISDDEGPEPPSAASEAARQPLLLDITWSPATGAEDACRAAGAIGARALNWLGASGELRVRVVGDAEMADAHERYSGVAGTTDVLTFDMRDDASGPLDTDVLVCVDEARRQAEPSGRPIEHELALYIVHAALHCMGHDDKTEADAARMHRLEDEALTAAGVGPVFAPGTGTGTR